MLLLPVLFVFYGCICSGRCASIKPRDSERDPGATQITSELTNEEQIFLTTLVTPIVECFSETVKVAPTHQSATEKLLDELSDNISHSDSESLPPAVQSLQSETPDFEESEKNITFSGILPKVDALQGEIGYNSEIVVEIGSEPQTIQAIEEVEAPPIPNVIDNDNEDDSDGNLEKPDVNILDLLKQAVQDSPTTITEAEKEDDMLIWELIEFLIMLTPIQEDERPMHWWRVLVEAVQCSMRHCSFTPPKEKAIRLPKIIKRLRRRDAPGVAPCRCQALEKIFLQAGLI